jgi:Flp pilus assembly protein TadD
LGRASVAAQKAEKVGSQDPIVCHALAMYYSESGQSGRAAQFEARLAESPKSDPDATARAAALYLNAGDTEESLVLARKSVAQQPSAAHEDLLGRALVASGQLVEGTQHFRSAAQLAPTDAKIAFDYAQALLRKEEFGGAADALGPALQAHPDDAQLVLAMGVARYGQRRFEECVVLFLRVIKLDPNIEQPYVFLGKIIDQAGSHLSEITHAYRARVALQPRNATGISLLAKALLASGGNDEEAEALLRRSILIDNRIWESYYELGALLVKKRDYQGALGELLHSVNLDPQQPAPHYQLARVYDRLGQPEKAKAEREIHQKLSNSNPSSDRR